ncbi:methyl-accepting chemotaxis protein [Heliophilum fasciatum]|uniref:Methyl-accepting chemotaxis sensory transducer with Cache sensor n=1 Tax=Heliophilum fasciatum TaxID=35700 RepID=A0A4R2RPT8_9FIRM|nr:methyl-accepting chemotaxis protein [Heliophilum fasciatum]MCW2277983.1 methyl-accepting chemotaxis protein [Heliophilum fasciatum]TCP64397.1 methyl-accepting chemotaxis sensory transducer with Cache sensor [Heliophilum fasciatum]
MKLQVKMLSLILVPVILIFSVMTAYTSITFYRFDVEDATRLAIADGQALSSQAQAYLEIRLNNARTLAAVMEGMRKDEATVNRNTANELLKAMLEDNEDILGVWCAFEPNALDGKDRNYINRPGHDSSGRFIPHWNRVNGTIQVEPLQGYTTPGEGDYYLLPFKNEKATIVEPYEATIGGRKILITTVAFPIHHEGKAIGAVGIDIAVDQLQKLVTATDTLKNGYGRLLTNQGIVVAHPQPELVGKRADEFANSNGPDILSVIRNGNPFAYTTYSAELGEDIFMSYVPVPLGDTGTPWSVAITVPQKEIIAATNAMVFKLVLIALLGVVIIAVLVFFSVRTIARPIIDVTHVLDQLSHYDFSEGTTNLNSRRNDELGTMAESLSHMRTNVVNLFKELRNAAQKVTDSAQNMGETSQQSAQAADEIARTIEEIATGASEQARNTEEGAGKINRMGEIIDQDQQRRQHLYSAVETVVKLKDEGNRILQDLVEKTNASQKSAQAIYEVVVHVDQSAEKIGTASEMIKSIAGQTNLLALNAAIEAARAGEAGRGFTIVATEIRKLAEASSTFTEEIGEIVQDLITKTSNAVETMNHLSRLVSDQAHSVELTRSKFAGISGAIEQTNAVIEALNRSGEAMEQKKQEIIHVIENLSAIAEQNAACTEEASASVEEQTAGLNEIANASMALANLAAEMQREIAKFKF